MNDGSHEKVSAAGTTGGAFAQGRGGSAVGGVVVGFLVGFLVAWVSRPPLVEAPAAAPAPASASASAADTPGVPATKVAGGPPEVALDFGTDGGDSALRGTWSRAQLRLHSVAQATGPEASIEIPLTPQPTGYALAVLAEAVGVGADEALDVGVRLNKRQLARWRVGPDWDMQGIVLPTGSLVSGVNVLEFTLPPEARDPKPMLAIDTLHLGPILPHAEASLGSVSVRGSLIRGYHGKEGEGAQAATWSAGLRTRAGFLLAPADGPYELALDGYAFGPLQPLEVEAVVNLRSIGSAKVDKGPRSVFSIPAGVLTVGLNIVELVYPKAVKPSDTVKGSQDQRDLAIRISALTVAPAPAAPAAAASR